MFLPFQISKTNWNKFKTNRTIWKSMPENLVRGELLMTVVELSQWALLEVLYFKESKDLEMPQVECPEDLLWVFRVFLIFICRLSSFIRMYEICSIRNRIVVITSPPYVQIRFFFGLVRVSMIFCPSTLSCTSSVLRTIVLHCMAFYNRCKTLIVFFTQLIRHPTLRLGGVWNNHL